MKNKVNLKLIKCTNTMQCSCKKTLVKQVWSGYSFPLYLLIHKHTHTIRRMGRRKTWPWKSWNFFSNVKFQINMCVCAKEGTCLLFEQDKNLLLLMFSCFFRWVLKKISTKFSSIFNFIIIIIIVIILRKFVNK